MTGPRYFDPDGEPITLEDWTHLHGERDPGGCWARESLKTEIGSDVTVSTVWLGLDHGFGYGPPEIFETMIFGGALDLELWRYSTREEARQGHAEAVALARADVELEAAKQAGEASRDE